MNVYRKMIEDTDLKNIFFFSSLGRRTIRHRLGVKDNQVSAILFSAVARGILYRVRGSDIGYNGHRKRFYAISK